VRGFLVESAAGSLAELASCLCFLTIGSLGVAGALIFGSGAPSRSPQKVG